MTHVRSHTGYLMHDILLSHNVALPRLIALSYGTTLPLAVRANGECRESQQCVRANSAVRANSVEPLPLLQGPTVTPPGGFLHFAPKVAPGEEGNGSERALRVGLRWPESARLSTTRRQRCVGWRHGRGDQCSP